MLLEICFVYSDSSLLKFCMEEKGVVLCCVVLCYDVLCHACVNVEGNAHGMDSCVLFVCCKNEGMFVQLEMRLITHQRICIMLKYESLQYILS
jgi:hypothetical protein